MQEHLSKRVAMPTNLTATLTALLDHWNTLADEAASKLDASEESLESEYYAGMIFGMEITRDELAAALAIALAEMAKG